MLAGLELGDQRVLRAREADQAWQESQDRMGQGYVRDVARVEIFWTYHMPSYSCIIFKGSIFHEFALIINVKFTIFFCYEQYQILFIAKKL